VRATGDADEHAEADRCRSAFGWAALLRTGAALDRAAGVVAGV